MKTSDVMDKQKPISLHQTMILFCAFSCLLSVTRVAFTGNPTYLFLIWNLFLAFIPYVISRVILLIDITRTVRVLLLGVWLLFVPNSFYLLTDLFHLPRFADVPAWFDLLLLLSFGINGMLLGVISLRKIEIVLEKLRGRALPLMFVFVVMFLNAFGIYLGRYLRFNSWDIVTRPFALFEELYLIIANPFDNLMEWGMVGSYAVFMTLIYFIIKKLGESLFSVNNKINL